MIPMPRRVGSLFVLLPSRRNAVRQAALFDIDATATGSPTKDNKHPNSPKDTKNIIVFGETGVGKSSLINLIAGKKVSATSSAAAGCTLEYQQHLLTLDDQRYAIWDTAGLDEGTEGSVPAEKAEAYLKQLIQDLAKSGGVDLLVYCVRGARLRSALLTNYHLFYSAICRKKVPIAIVITGLENQAGNMETWWQRNAPEFTALKMSFDSHACVTTLDPYVDNAELKERREMSRTAVITMITNTCRTQQWKPAERSWIESAFSDIRAMLSPKHGHDTPLANVIICDASQSCPDTRDIRKRTISFHKPVSLSLSLSPVTFRSPVSFSNEKSAYLPFHESIRSIPECLFRVYQVPRRQRPPEVSDGEAKTFTMVKRGAELLIFCSRIEDESADVRSQWRHFTITYGGDLSPQIVVVIGASGQRSAEEWWRDTVDEEALKHDVRVAYWPTSEAADMEEAGQQLRNLINESCIDCSKVTFTKAENIFRRPLHLDMTGLATLWMKQESSAKDERSPKGDLLTQWHVWKEAAPDKSPISPTKDKGGR